MNKRHVKHMKPVDPVQVHAALVRLLTDTLPLDLDARDLDEETLWDILLYATFHQTTIESACLELGVSSGTITRNHLTAELGDAPSALLGLERQLNHALRTQLPRSFRRHLIAVRMTWRLIWWNYPINANRIVTPKKYVADLPRQTPPIFTPMPPSPSSMMINAMNSP